MLYQLEQPKSDAATAPSLQILTYSGRVSPALNIETCTFSHYQQSLSFSYTSSCTLSSILSINSHSPSVVPLHAHCHLFYLSTVTLLQLYLFMHTVIYFIYQQSLSFSCTSSCTLSSILSINSHSPSVVPLHAHCHLFYL